MRDILDDLAPWLLRREPFALATVVRTWQSSPRPAGAAMAVSSAGQVIGSVSGGCIEGALYELAKEVLADGSARSETYRVADDDARWFNFQSDVFAQLDKGFDGDPDRDGFFLVTSESQTLALGVEADFDAFAPTVFAEVGGGPSVFEDEDEFTAIGTLEWDDITGSVTSLTLDFDDFVAYNDATINFVPSEDLGYETIVSSVSGTVTMVGSYVALIDLAADVQFAYSAAGVDYDGSIIFDGKRFDLYVDEEEAVAFVGPIRLAWDIEGDVANVVPEPQSALAVGLLASLMLARRRAVRDRIER